MPLYLCTKGGSPGLSDQLLTAAGPPILIAGAIACFEPVLAWVGRAHEYLGFALVFAVAGIFGALGMVLFFRIERRLRPEFVFPRRVFGIAAVPLAGILHMTVLDSALSPRILQGALTFAEANAVALIAVLGAPRFRYALCR
jgi:hypothetical protein